MANGFDNEDEKPSYGKMALNKGKDIAKMYAKKAIKAFAKKILKLIGKLLLKMIAKLLAAALAYIGIPALLIIALAIIVGGGIMYAAMTFDWLSDSKDAAKLKSAYESAIVQTTKLEEYRPPMLVVQAIDNIRMTKEDLDNTDIDPVRIAQALKPDLTYKDFTNTTVTIEEHEESEEKTDEDGNTYSETHTWTSTSTSHDTVSLLVKAHAWNRIEIITYHEETTTTTSGNTTTIRTVWVRDTLSCPAPVQLPSAGGEYQSTVGGSSGQSHPFFLLYGQSATEEEKRSGIPAAITLAQAALESGWGQSELASRYYNFFGIKASSGWAGSVVTYDTSEQNSNGSWITIQAKFRAYSNATEGFSDHSRFLLENGRYAPVLAQKNPYAFANGLQAAGYATDQQYGYKLRSLIHQYNLTQFDVDKGIDSATGQPYNDVAYTGPIGGGNSGGVSSGCGTPDFTKFDSILTALHFTTDDASMAMLSINENDPGHSMISNYNGSFTEAAYIILPSAEDNPTAQFGYPLAIQATMTSDFINRINPVTGKPENHKGIDLAAPQGTEIRAAESGIVVSSGWSDSYGNNIIIDHGNGLATLYGHIMNNGLYVKQGDTVSRGQRIAGVGSTGQSTGNHLHFEVRVDQVPTDPKPYLR